MSGTLLALSLVSLHLNLDTPDGNEETQCMLISASQRTVLLVANNDDRVTASWLNNYLLRVSGSNLLETAMGRAKYLNPLSGSKMLIYNQVKDAFRGYTPEWLKHKKFSSELGHLNLNIEDSLGLDTDGNKTTILVTGNDGKLGSVSGAVHAEQKLVAALERIERSRQLDIQDVWVAGCKRACNLCHTKLAGFRASVAGRYGFEFESQQLNTCQGSQRTVRYD